MIASTAFFASLVLAAHGLTINTPSQVRQCIPVSLSWSGGESPYFLQVLQGGSTTDTLVDLGEQDGTSYTWTTNLSPGTSITLGITDSSGDTKYSDAVSVTSGSGSSCDASGSSASGGSGSSGSSTAAGSGSSASETDSSDASASSEATTSSKAAAAAKSSDSKSDDAKSSASSSSTESSGASAIAVSAAGVLGAGAVALLI